MADVNKKTYRCYYHIEGCIEIPADDDSDMMMRFYDTCNDELQANTFQGVSLDDWEVVEAD